MDEQRATQIERRVPEVIQSTCAQLRKEPSSRVWTAAICQAITQLGHQYGYKVRGAQPRIDPKGWDIGWLWDITWVESSSNNELLKIPLILESEWNPTESEILWDFQKLLASRAAIRVMIFNAPTTDDAKRIFARMRGLSNLFWAAVWEIVICSRAGATDHVKASSNSTATSIQTKPGHDAGAQLVQQLQNRKAVKENTARPLQGLVAHAFVSRRSGPHVKIDLDIAPMPH